MQNTFRAILCGFAGAIATNVSHELLRRVTPLAPRVDLLGMQAMAKMYRAVDAPPPTGRTLYLRTLIGDIAANTLYFSFAAIGGRRAAPFGTALGIVAGMGAFFVPEHTDLDEGPTARTPLTKAFVTALYTIGGATSGTLYERTMPLDAQ